MMESKKYTEIKEIVFRHYAWLHKVSMEIQETMRQRKEWHLYAVKYRPLIREIWNKEVPNYLLKLEKYKN